MAQPSDTRARILDAAESLFFADGIAVTGVDKVASVAGVAIVTLYKHFGSKDNLLREVLARRFLDWNRHWDEAIASADTPEDRLLAVFDATVRFRAAAGATQWCCFLATASERPRPADAQADPVFTLIEQDTRLVTDRLRTLADEAGCEDPATVADMLLVLYNGALSSLLRGAPLEPVALARRVARGVVDSSQPAASTAAPPGS